MTFEPDRYAATLLASMANATVRSNADGNMRYRNKVSKFGCGSAASESLGQTLDLIIPTSLRQAAARTP